MTTIFEPNICYPSDQYGGRYTEFAGQITNINWLRVDVLTKEHGILSGYVDEFYEDRPHLMPQVGDIAVIRCYNYGGGWYPDDRIVSWITKPLEKIFNEND